MRLELITIFDKLFAENQKLGMVGLTIRAEMRNSAI